MPDHTLDLVLFKFEGQKVRAVEIDGDRWVVVSDLAKLLGFREAKDAARNLRPHHKGSAEVPTPGGRQRMLITNERGANRLILRSKSSKAEAIQDWITDEVMPSIIRTGKYVAPDHVRQMLGLELDRTELEGEADRERWRAEELQQQLDNVLADRDRWRREAYARRCDHPKREEDGSCIHDRACSYVG